MVEFVTLTKWVGDERMLNAHQSMEIRFTPLEPGRISVATEGIAVRTEGSPPWGDDPEPEPEDYPVGCRTELFRPGDVDPVATALGGLPRNEPLRYDATEHDLELVGEWICRVTNRENRRGRFVASVALPYQVELWTATLDLSFVNHLIARALEAARLSVHLQTHDTEKRSWITYSNAIAEQFGLPQRVSFSLEPFPAELPFIHEPIYISLNDFNSNFLHAAFVQREAGEMRLLVTARFETEGRELTTSIGLSHDIRHFSVTVEFRLDGSSPHVVCSLEPAEFEILGHSVRNVRDEVRNSLIAQLGKADLRATVSRYLNDFFSHMVRLGNGARTHRVSIEGQQIVFKYYNEKPQARRPLPPVKLFYSTPPRAYPIRVKVVLDPSRSHRIPLPLSMAGLVTVVSRVSPKRLPPVEIDPESGQPIPGPRIGPQSVRLIREGRNNVTEIVAEIHESNEIIVLNKTIRDVDAPGSAWSLAVINGGENPVKVDVTVSYPKVPGNLGKFDHIVILMMENRSFDHMLGYLSLDGRADVDGLTGRESNSFEGEDFKVFPLETTQFCDDPGHDGRDVDEQISNGMRGFVANFARLARRQHEPPGRIMGYHTGEQLRAYDLLAREFAICDRWFSSVPGYTWPNRFFSLCGTSDGTRDGLPIEWDNPPVYDFKSIFEILHGYRVSWSYFFSDLPFPVLIRRFVQDAAFSRSLRPIREFFEQARTGDLPAVTWLEPYYMDIDDDIPGSDDHPPGDVAAGQHFVASVYRALVNSPLWQRTLLVITYDEHGGFYDHVVPPSAPGGAFRAPRLGVRVPAFVVSPWVSRGHVEKHVYDHTAILRTILDRFCSSGGEPPSMGERVDHARNLAELLIEEQPRAAPTMPYVPQAPGRPCNRPSDRAPDDLAEVLMWISHGIRAP
jgi:phospholipase C